MCKSEGVHVELTKECMKMGGTSEIVYVAEGTILLRLTFRRRVIVCKSEGVQVELTKECMKMGGTSEMENHYCNACMDIKAERRR